MAFWAFGLGAWQYSANRTKTYMACLAVTYVMEAATEEALSSGEWKG